MIPQSEIVIMAVVAVISVLLPFIFMFVLRKWFKVRWIPFLIGIAVFLIFALILEQLLHAAVLKPSADGSIELLTVSPWLYVLYGVLAAGVFEETGRLLAFLMTKKYYRDIDSAVSYGIGHGGFEAAAVVGISMINGIVIAMMVNSGSDALNAVPIPAENLIQSQPWYMYSIAIFERIFAMILHISLSIIVFSAVMMQKKWWLYPFAILLHALANVTAAMLQSGLLSNMYIMYAGFIVVTAATAAIAVKLVKIYRNQSDAL